MRAVCLLLVIGLSPARSFAQAADKPSFWGAGTLGFGAQGRHCACSDGAPDPAEGLALTGSAGVILPIGIGLGLSKTLWLHPDFAENGDGRNTSVSTVLVRYRLPISGLSVHAGVGSAVSEDDALNT